MAAYVVSGGIDGAASLFSGSSAGAPSTSRSLAANALGGVAAGQLQPYGGAAAAAEHGRRLGPEQGEQTVGVVGVRLHPLLLRDIVEAAARQAPPVVGDDGVPVGEPIGDRVEGPGVAAGGWIRSRMGPEPRTL
jgi:hypothetical protein